MDLNTTLLVAALGVAVLSAVTGAVVGTRTRSSAIIPTLGAGLVATVLAFLVVGTQYELDMFGVLHLVYLVVTIAVPLTALTLVWALRSHLGRGARLALVLLVLPAPVGVYATHVEPFWLRIDRVAFPVDPSHAGVRIGVLADLQTPTIGDYEVDAIDTLLAQKPDLVVIPGDFWQTESGTFAPRAPMFAAQLQRIDVAVEHVVAVSGDTDSVVDLRTIAAGTDVHVLDDETIDLVVSGRPVRIAGISLGDDEGIPDMLADLRSETPDDPFRLLVAHRPDEVERITAADGVDLVIAGHTHGGQIRFPFLPPPVDLSSVPNTVGGGGLHDLDGVRIYVSTGVGRERIQAPQVRFGVRPSIGIIDLVPPAAAN